MWVVLLPGKSGFGQIFDIYYDRAIKSVDDRKGEWVLYRELEQLSRNDFTPL